MGWYTVTGMRTEAWDLSFGLRVGELSFLRRAVTFDGVAVGVG